MLPSLKISPYLSLILLLLSVLIVVIPAQESGAKGLFILNADDIQANRWMTLDAPKRASFVIGFLAGLDHVYGSMGLIVTLNKSLSAHELSSEVYDVLLDQPELRTGPIDKIILNALDKVLVIIDKNGKRVDAGLRNISFMIQ